MEVVPMRLPKSNGPDPTVGLPFNRRNVEEWSRLDQLTGIMEKAKIETNHWAARTANAAHNYGKVVDSRERNNIDGSIQERQRKQMEVYQTKVPGGSMQVIRTQTITTSSKKWSSTTDSSKGFDDLTLPVHSLDLTSQKTKGSVGRSGSIGGRRPPTRPRSLISQLSKSSLFEEEPSSEFRFHRLHPQSDPFFQDFTGKSDCENEPSGVVITDITNQPSTNETTTPAKIALSRQKSNSNENVTADADTDSLLMRSSKVRRSLQCHKQSQSNLVNESPADDCDLVSRKSLKERAAEIEKLLGRGGSSVQLPPTPEKSPEPYKIKFLKTKDSFVSAETLKEVRERLKKSHLTEDNDLKDDGIVTEKNEFQMNGHVEGTHRKPNINGTGSLESKYSNRSSTNGSRTSEWYRRRKSYGFEQVDEYDKFDKFDKKKNHMDSSTDSGICQSSETMSYTPTWTKNSDSTWTKIISDFPSKKDSSSNVVTVRVKKDPFLGDPFTDKSTNSVYLDGNRNSFSIRNEDSIKKATFNSSYKEDSDVSPINSAWKPKSPIQFINTQNNGETIKSSLRSSKNPWLSQLRGTKLADRDWGTDEMESSDNKKSESERNDNLNAGSIIFEKKEDFGGDSNNQKKSKKVEFCKTEVHFAAESGKFNIVETDGKPPPNDIFRRRRRHTGPSGAQTKYMNGFPEIKFGDSPLEKSMLTTPEKVESLSEKIEAELKELSRIVIAALPASEKPTETPDSFKRKNSWLYDVAEEPATVPENEFSSNVSQPRSILKSYGNSFGIDGNEFCKTKLIDPSEVFRKSPVPVWQSTIVLRNKRFDDFRKNNDEEQKLYSSDGESELQMRIRNLRKTSPDNPTSKKPWNASSPFEGASNWKTDSKRRSLPDDVLFRNVNDTRCDNRYNHHRQLRTNRTEESSNISVPIEEMPMLSVAERIRQVEQLKGNNYSTKINFRSGEMTVVQNGASHSDESNYDDEKKLRLTSWSNQRKIRSSDESKKEVERHEPVVSCDELPTSNPPVMRFSTHADKADNQKYQTTRILINFKTLSKNEKSNETTTTTTKDHLQPREMIDNTCNNGKNKLYTQSGSWSSATAKKDLTKYLKELKSTNLMRETFGEPTSHQKENIPKPSKPVHEIIDQFDSLSRSSTKEKRRKSIPYRTSKEYTQSDLEEELKNFTENLDKDFRDIYEEEIGSFRKSRSLRETKSKCAEYSNADLLGSPIFRPLTTRYCSLKAASSGDEATSKKSSLRTSSMDNYDTDDSDLLADEEVRSYMSAGQGASESETEFSGQRKSFRESILRFKKLESQSNSQKEIRSNAHASAISKPKDSIEKLRELNSEPNRKTIASIALKYEDDPFFSKRIYQNLRNLKLSPSQAMNVSSNEMSTPEGWDRASNSSSAMSSTKARERISYLKGPSLSEKYSKYPRESSSSSINTTSDYPTSKKEQTPETTYLNEFEDKYPPKDKIFNETGKKKENAPCYSKSFPRKESSYGSRKEEKYASGRSDSRRSKKPDSDKSPNRESVIDKYQMKQTVLLETSKRKERNQTDEDLEELKRAAEEIVLAVNGYTDDSSHKGSSDEEKSRRIIRKDKIGNLGTISEGKRVTKTETRKTISTHAHARTTLNHSSASSTESLHKESHKSSRETKSGRHRSSHRTKHGEASSSAAGTTSSSKPASSRPSRSLQRASREASLGHRSSSEDIPSCVEQVKRRVIRRPKSGSSSKPEVTTSEVKVSSERHRSRSKSRGSEPSAALGTRSSKSERHKESASLSRSSRSSRMHEMEKSSRKLATEKSDVETVKKRRSQRIASKGEHSTDQNQKKKVNGIKRLEAFKFAQST